MALRIAHFVQRYPPALGGSEAYFQRLSQHLVSAGHEVTVWTTNAVNLEAFWSTGGRTVSCGEEYDRGVKVRRFQCNRWPLRRYMLKALSFLPGSTWKAMTMPSNPISFRMWREAGASNERFDVVHATAFPYAWPIVCARRLARRSGARFLITPFLHLGSPGDPVDRTRRAYLAPHLKHLLLSADGIFVQTPSERAALLARGADEKKVILQGMGVAPAECTGGDRESARSRWGVGSSEVVIGHLANLSVEKGTVDLLIAADHAWNKGAEFRILLAGPDMSNFRRFWESYSRKDRVSLLGVLDEHQKRDFFAGIDVFVLPSRSDSFGLVLLEAWANGVPNIAYRAGGVADVIQHNQDGLLVTCGAIEELTAGLKRLVNDNELRHRLGQAGLTRIADEFRWPDKLRIVVDAYDRLVSR